MGSAALRTHLRHLPVYHDLAAVVAIISRNPVSPPELTGNTPVADILQPVQIRLVEALRHESQIAVLDGLDSWLCHFLHLYEPLLLDHGLNSGAAAVVGSYVMDMVYHLHQQPLLLQFLYHDLAGLVAIHACVLAAVLIDGCVVVQNIDLRQVMTLSYLEIVGVMCRGNLYYAGTKLLIYISVCDNRNLTTYQRQDHGLTYDIFIPLVIRVYCQGAVAKQGFRSGGSDLYELVTALNRIIDMPEMACLLLVLYLCVRDRGLADRTPVDDTGSLIDIALLMQAQEYLLYGLGAALVHGEALSVPVAGGANLLQLIYDGAAILFPPLPGSL